MGLKDYSVNNDGFKNKKLHRLLQRQINTLNNVTINNSEFENFIDAVNNAYIGFDEDHMFLEHTLEISSNELFKVNEDLFITKTNLEVIVEERTRKLAESETLFRTLIESSYDIITIVDKDGAFKYESPSVKSTLGYTPEELIDNKYLDYIHPEDLSIVSDAIKNSFINHSEVLTLEYRFKNKQGNYIWIESTGKYINDNNSIAGLVLNSRDINERYLTQEKIKLQSYLLNTIAANMPISIYTLDKKGCILSINGSALDIAVCDTGSIIGTNVYNIFIDKQEEIDIAIAGGVVNFKNTIVKNQEFFFETFIFPANSSTEVALIAFTIDITKEKLQENNIKAYYNNLERINKDLDQYAYIVSHDLKAPLRAIRSLSEFIEVELGELITDEVGKDFELMRGRIRRMELLINGILEYSKAGRQINNSELFSVNDLVSDIITTILPSNLHSFDVQVAMPVINADKIKIEQVFSNYISNAIKYNNNPKPIINIGYTKTETHYNFYVKDNGPGIDPDYHEKVFAIFQTINPKDNVESTGVGLAIVKKIVEEAGGKVWVESEPGNGSAFYFSLPINS